MMLFVFLLDKALQAMTNTLGSRGICVAYLVYSYH